MTTLYKLTDYRDQTGPYYPIQWGEGVTHSADLHLVPELCTGGVIHAYRSPLVAEFLSPAHISWWRTAHLWEAEGDVVVDDGTKVGCRSLTTIRRLAFKPVTIDHRLRFAILVAKARGSWSSPWNQWADDWIVGTRTDPGVVARPFELPYLERHTLHLAKRVLLGPIAAAIGETAAYTVIGATPTSTLSRLDLAALAEQACAG